MIWKYWTLAREHVFLMVIENNGKEMIGFSSISKYPAGLNIYFVCSVEY